MLTNSFKILAVGASLVGLVACGKGMGEKNNLTIDGKYADRSGSLIATDGKPSVSKDVVTVISIDNGVRTQYRIRQGKEEVVNGEKVNVKGQVEISKYRFIIKGATVIGTEDIQDDCKEESEFGVTARSAKIQKSESALVLAEEDNYIQLDKISDEDFAKLTLNIDNREMFEEVCMDDRGKTIYKLDDKKAEDATTTEQDKIKAEQEAAAKAADEAALNAGKENVDNEKEALEAPETEAQAAEQAQAAKQVGPKE